MTMDRMKSIVIIASDFFEPVCGFVKEPEQDQSGCQEDRGKHGHNNFKRNAAASEPK